MIRKTILHILITLTIALHTLDGHSQSMSISIIDSIKQQLAEEENKNKRAILLAELGRELIFIDQNQSFEYLEEAATIANELKNELVRAKVYRNTGTLLMVQKSFITGLEYISIAKEIYTKNNDRIGIANCNLSLGLAYEQIGQASKAIIYSTLAYRTFKELDKKTRLGVITNNLASHYINNNRLDSAEKFLKISISNNKELNNYPVLASNYRLALKLAFLRNKVDSAKSFGFKAFALAKQYNYRVNQQALIETAILMHEIYQWSSNKDSSIHYLQLAERLSKENNFIELLKDVQWHYLNLPETWFSENQESARLNYYKVLSDSIQNIQFTNQIKSIDLIKRTFEAENDVALLNSTKELNEATISRQRSQLIFGFIILSLAAASSLLIWKSRSKLKRFNHQYQRTQDELLASTNEIKLQNKTLKQQQIALENNRLVMRSFIDALPLMIALTDSQGKIVIANKTYNEVFSFKQGEIEGMHYTEFLPEEVLQKHQKYIDQALEGEEIKLEESYKLNDNKTVYFFGTYTPIFKDNELIYIAFFNLNITKLKEAQMHLETLNQTKDKLVSILAHDFKAPMNTLLGISEILLKDIDAFSKKELKELGTSINQNIKNTLNLANNLLVWSRSQMEELKTEPQLINVYTLLQQVIDEVTPSLHSKNVQVHNKVEKETEAYFDKDQITIVLRNLIMNAIKYSSSGSSVDIYSKLHNDSGQVQISVCDHGIGMDAATVDALFSKFTKSKPGTSGESGTGLGLMICKDFIEGNKGSIWVESQLYKGASFHFTLPTQ